MDNPERSTGRAVIEPGTIKWMFSEQENVSWHQLLLLLHRLWFMPPLLAPLTALCPEGLLCAARS